MRAESLKRVKKGFWSEWSRTPHCLYCCFCWLPWCNRGRPFGATRLLGASFLYHPLFWWRNRGAWEPSFCTTIFGATLVQPAPFYTGWRTSGAHPKPPIVYTGAHPPSRPSPILGQFWRTCCFLTSWSTILWFSPSMPSCTC